MSKRKRCTVAESDVIDLTGDSDGDVEVPAGTGTAAASAAAQRQQHSNTDRPKRVRKEIIKSTGARLSALAWEVQKLGPPGSLTSGFSMCPLSLGIALSLALRGAGKSSIHLRVRDVHALHISTSHEGPNNFRQHSTAQHSTAQHLTA
jgi:hypothetical protein